MFVTWHSWKPECRSGIDELGEIDIVIANAGVVAIGDTQTHSEPVFNTIVDTNLKGVWHTMLATVAVDHPQGPGRLRRSGQFVAGPDRQGR